MLHTVTRCLIMQKARGRTLFRRIIVLPLLVNTRFQVYFTPLVGLLFTFPSRYWFTIGHQGVFRLGRWSSQIQTGFLVSRPTQDTHRAFSIAGYGAFTLSRYTFQYILLTNQVPQLSPTTPYDRNHTVWPNPRSLAATRGISVDVFS